MTRLYLLIGGVSAVLCIGVALYFMDGQGLGDKLDQANDTINTSRDFNDAIANPDLCTWTQRLHGDCPD